MADAAVPYAPFYDGGSVSRWSAVVYTQNGTALDLSPALVSVGFGKSIEAAAGTWNLTLKTRTKTRQQWDELIEDDDWLVLECEIAVRDAPPLRYLVTVGLVDSVREIRRAGGGGAEVVEYVVAGRDFGKVFEETEVYFQTAAAEAVRRQEEGAGRLFDAGFAGAIFFRPGDFTPSGTPTDMLQQVIAAFLGREGLVGAQWRMPSGVGHHVGRPPLPQAPALRRLRDAKADTIGAYLDAEALVDETNGFMAELGFLNLSGQSGKLHAMLLQYTEPILHELFYDVRPLVYGMRAVPLPGTSSSAPKPKEALAVIFRRRPFPEVVTGLEGQGHTRDSYVDGQRGPWSALRTHLVAGHDVTLANVGRGGHERMNFFAVSPTSDFLPGGDPIIVAAGIGAVSADVGSIQIHGLRRFEHQTHFGRHVGPMPAGTNVERDLAYAKEIHDRIRLWYSLNAHFYNGSIVLKRLYPRIRIGERVQVEWRSGKRTMFYVEGVQHEWRYPQRGTTTLTVTRGVRDGDLRVARVATGGRT